MGDLLAPEVGTGSPTFSSHKRNYPFDKGSPKE